MSRQGIGLSLFRQQGGRDLGTRDRPRRGSATPRARDSIDLSLRGPDNAAMTSARRSSARSLRLLLPAARVILAAAFALALAGCGSNSTIQLVYGFVNSFHGRGHEADSLDLNNTGGN